MRRGARLAAVAMLLIALHGCGRGTVESAGKVHITLWTGWTGDEEREFRSVLARYQAEHPNVVVDDLGGVNDDTKTLRAIVAGVPPDAFAIWNPNYLGPLAANGALMPLDDRFRASGLREEDFVPAALGQCRYRGRLYAMPYLVDVVALLWNKRAFRAAGLDPDRPPATIEELADYAVKLTRRDPATGEITQIGLQPMDDLSLFDQDFGGKLYDPAANRVTPDDPANVTALQWYVDLIRRMGGYTQVNAFTAGFGPAQGASNPFFVGKVAMLFSGEYTPYWCHRYAPALEYGVAPIPPPAARPDRARSTWLGGNFFCIPRGSQHPKEAWDLLVWMQSDEAQIMLSSLLNNVPNRRGPLKAPQLRTGADYKRNFGMFLDLADSPNGGYFPVMAAANLYFQQLLDARDKVLNGQSTPSQALAQVRVRVQRELDRYR